jgi:solute carrier family 13 (sodium-dependent dicarboxylate transporter), member 2/3/5
MGARVRWAGLVVGPLVGFAVFQVAPEAAVDAAGEVVRGLTQEGRVTAGVGALMAVWWLTEAVPLSATALLPIALLPLLGARTIGEATAPYADPVIFLFLGGFILGLAMQRWGLHRRIALATILLVGTAPRRLIAGFMLASAVMSMWVSNTATVAMMLPIGISVIHLVFARLGRDDDPARPPEPAGPGANFATALMLGIAYAASIGGVGTLIGTPPNVILKGYVELTYGQEIGFAAWLAVGLPLVAVFLPLAWLYLTRIAFPVRLEAIPGGRAMIQAELRGLGRPAAGERAVFLVFTLTALCWILRPQLVRATGLTGLTDEGIAVVAATVLFLIPANARERTFVMDWETASKLPWGILILFGGGLSLAAAIQANGVDRFIGGGFAALAGVPPWLIVLAVALGTIFLTELTSNTAVTNTLMPVLGGGGAAAVLGVDAAFLLIPAAIAASYAFMLPVATPPNAIVFGSGYVRLPQMVKAGVWLNLVGALLVTTMAYFLAGTLLRLDLGGPPGPG